MIEKDKVVLDFPKIELISSYTEALREGFQRGIQPLKTEEEIQCMQSDAERYIESLNYQEGLVELANGDIVKKVPYETLWLFQDNIFIGESSFRHELNDNLRLHGGHVGYGIRPSLQGQGLGVLILELTRQRAACMGMDKLLLTCSPSNLASEKIILKNGGIYIDTQENPFGFGPTKRFWVKTA